MNWRLFLITIVAALASLGAVAQTDSACNEDACKGLFTVGPYKIQFYATQDETGATRFFREIPSFGPTHLNIEFAEGARPADDQSVDVTLYWGKNELKPPQLLDTRHAHGAAPIALDHDFTEDGRYIVAIDITRPGETAAQGRYVFYVIQTAESGIPVAAFMTAATALFVFLIWKTRRPKAGSPRQRFR